MSEMIVRYGEDGRPYSEAPLVRCQDCKYYNDGFCYNPNTYDDEKTRGNTVPDWYCADGKGKRTMNKCIHLDKDGNCALHEQFFGCRDSNWHELCCDYDENGPALQAKPWICSDCKYHNIHAKICERGMNMMIVTNTTPIYRTLCTMYEKREDSSVERPSKPPLGVSPYYVFYPDRIRALCDVISRHTEDTDKKCVHDWMDELRLLMDLMNSMKTRDENNA